MFVCTLRYRVIISHMLQIRVIIGGCSLYLPFYFLFFYIKLLKKNNLMIIGLFKNNIKIDYLQIVELNFLFSRHLIRSFSIIIYKNVIFRFIYIYVYNNNN